MKRPLAIALVALFTLALTPTPALAITPDVSIVMRGLNNPRGLNFAPNGALYVAEAGRGGTQPCFPSPEGGGTSLAGLSGSISRLWRGTQDRIVTGLPSHAGPDGTGALGPHDVIFAGNLFLTVGLGGDPAERAGCGTIGADFGWLVRANVRGDARNEVDLAAYEASANPDGGIHDSNPYGLLAARGGGDEDGDGEIVATDAGGNSLLAIGRDAGQVRTLATFPSRSSGRNTDAVPTSVARGPDGALYVGELTGFPFIPGTANVYRVDAAGNRTVFRSGFSFITDITFGSDGSLYVLQFSSDPFPVGPGSIVRVTPSGTRSVVFAGLVTPTGLAIGRDGALYVSNCGVFPAGTDGPPPCAAGGGGHVLRIKP